MLGVPYCTHVLKELAYDTGSPTIIVFRDWLNLGAKLYFVGNIVLGNRKHLSTILYCGMVWVLGAPGYNVALKLRFVVSMATLNNYFLQFYLL